MSLCTYCRYNYYCKNTTSQKSQDFRTSDTYVLLTDSRPQVPSGFLEALPGSFLKGVGKAETNQSGFPGPTSASTRAMPL